MIGDSILAGVSRAKAISAATRQVSGLENEAGKLQQNQLMVRVEPTDDGHVIRRRGLAMADAAFCGIRRSYRV